MNTAKNYVTIYLQLVQIDVLEKTLNEISNKICVPNKTEDLNLRLCNMITGMNESKTLEKHVSYKCE